MKTIAPSAALMIAIALLAAPLVVSCGSKKLDRPPERPASWIDEPVDTESTDTRGHYAVDAPEED